ncbi:hypothetical protein BH18ACT9_BH18ACT9_17900 [soil metagenome]
MISRASSYERMGTSAGLRVSDLVADPTLDTHVVAGADGLDTPILWAHACELPEPARWLGPNELLMTMGACVPPGSQAQQEFIAGLAEAGLAGMTLGEKVAPPSLHQGAARGS